MTPIKLIEFLIDTHQTLVIAQRSFLLQLEILKLLNQLYPQCLLLFVFTFGNGYPLAPRLLLELFLLLVALVLFRPVVVLLLLIAAAILLLAALIGILTGLLRVILHHRPRLLLVPMLRLLVILSRLILLLILSRLLLLIVGRLLPLTSSLVVVLRLVLLLEIHLYLLTALCPTSTTSTTLLPAPNNHLRIALLLWRLHNLLVSVYYSARCLLLLPWFLLGLSTKVWHFILIVHRPTKHIRVGRLRLARFSALGWGWLDHGRVSAKGHLNSDWLLTSFFRRHIYIL